MNKHFLNSINNIFIEYVSGKSITIRKTVDSGSSGSFVSIVESNKKLYAVKIISPGKERVCLFDQGEKSNVIRNLMPGHVAKICWYGKIEDKKVLINETIGLNTYAEILENERYKKETMHKIWTDFLNEITFLWKRTTKKNQAGVSPSREFYSRHKRILEGIEQSTINDISLASLMDAEVNVNGKLYPSIRKTFDKLRDYQEPEYYVTCHGDPQPSNVVVNTETDEWELVDWEWTDERHDWRMMVAHLYGWWDTRALPDKTKTSFEVNDGVVTIDYETSNTSFVGTLKNDAYEATINYLNERLKKEDCVSINNFLSLLLFGELRFLEHAKKINIMPLALGRAIEYAHNDLFCEKNKHGHAL